MENVVMALYLGIVFALLFAWAVTHKKLMERDEENYLLKWYIFRKLKGADVKLNPEYLEEIAKADEDLIKKILAEANDKAMEKK